MARESNRSPIGCGRRRLSAMRSGSYAARIRSRLGLALLVLLVPLVLAIAPARAGTGTVDSRASSLAEAVESIAIVVSDLDRSVRFFRDVLAFDFEAETEHSGIERERLEGVFGARMRVARLRLGKESIELIEYLAPRGRPLPQDSRSNDRWFQHIAIIVRDMDEAYAHLRRHGVEHASAGPQKLPEWNASAGGIEAFYFKDPDGHALEILEFPKGKGHAKWHREGTELFLGIDHTAIVVASTEASLRFYRDRLGLQVAGESENYGTEQEHLNNVFGARLRITSLAAPAGPGVELLEYLAPRDGRPAPLDARSNDLAGWQIRFTARAPLEPAAAPLLREYGFVSPGVVSLPDGAGPYRNAFLMRDPDGHAVKVMEAPPAERGAQEPERRGRSQ